MTDLKSCSANNTIQISIGKDDGSFINCNPKFTVERLNDSVQADQEIGSLHCEDTTFKMTKASNDTIRIANKIYGTYDISLSESETPFSYLILATQKARSITPFNYTDSKEVKNYEETPILVKVKFNRPVKIKGKEEQIQERFLYFEKPEKMKDWLDVKVQPNVAVEFAYALKETDEQKKIIINFRTNEEKNAFLSNPEGFILITKEHNKEAPEQQRYSTASLLLDAINKMKDEIEEATLIHLQNGKGAIALTADNSGGKKPLEMLSHYAGYIKEQEETQYTISGFDVKELSWFEKRGVEIRGYIPRVGWNFHQREDYTLLNPDIQRGGIDEEYFRDYKNAQTDKDEKEFYESLGFGVGATFYLIGGFLGPGMNLNALFMDADWSGKDPTFDSDFALIMADLEFRWSLARTFGWNVLDPQVFAGIGYGYGWGMSTLQESYNPEYTKFSTGYGHLGAALNFKLANIGQNWELGLAPFFKAIFPFSEDFKTVRYGSTAADFSPFYEGGLGLVFSYQNKREHEITAKTSEPTYKKPEAKTVTLNSTTTFELPRPQALIPFEIKLPAPRVVSLKDISARFKLGKTELVPGDRKAVRNVLLQIKDKIKEVSSDSKLVIRIIGHTDSGGRTDKNDVLSMGRANEYKNLLITEALKLYNKNKAENEDLMQKLQNAKIYVEGKGESEPLDKDGKVIDIAGLGEGRAGKNDTWTFVRNDGTTVIEDRAKSRRIVATIEIYEPGTELPVPSGVSEFQLQQDAIIGMAIAKALNKSPFERAFYESKDNSINLVLNDLSERNLKKAKSAFFKTVRNVQKKKSSALSSSATIRFVIHADVEEAEERKIKDLFYKFSEWATLTAAPPEFVSEQKVKEIHEIVSEMKEAAEKKASEFAALLYETENGSFKIKLSDGTSEADIYPVKLAHAGASLSEAEKMVISKIANEDPREDVTLLLNFATPIKDDASVKNYAGLVAAATGKKRMDISSIYHQTDKRIGANYLFIVVSRKPISLSKGDDPDASLVRDKIFERFGPKESK